MTVMKAYAYTSCRWLALLLVQACLLLQAKSASAEDSGPTAIDGADVFLTYCAGCHGFDGHAAYEHAPSFSMGERLEKDDRELLQSVLNGKNAMPPWQDKLPVEDLRKAVSYLRIMHQRQKQGKNPRQEPLPNKYYLFTPLGEKQYERYPGVD